MTKIIFIFLIFFSFAFSAQSTECISVPKCSDMGYKLNAPKGEGWFCTACPTDPTKFACSEKPCPRGTKSRSTSTNCWGGKSGDTDCFYEAKERRSNPGGSNYAYEYTCD